MIFESLFFRWLEDHIYTEHVYAFFIALLNLSMLFLFWRKFTIEKEKNPPSLYLIWIVIACWFATPYFVYFYISGGLEMLANTFAFPSIYLLLISVNKKYSTYKTQIIIGTAALFLFISVLINGPLTLFPLVFYGLHWIIYKKFTANYYLKLTTILLINLVIIATVFFILFPESYINFEKYVHQNVITSLFANRYDAVLSGLDHLRIITWYLAEFKWLYLLSCILLLFLYKKDKSLFNKAITNYLFQNKEARLTLLISLSATLPIILSAKQSLYFTLQGGFFFLITFLLYLVPIITLLINDKVFPIKSNLRLPLLILVPLLSSLFIYPAFWTEIGNNGYEIMTEHYNPDSYRTYLNDAHTLGKIIPKQSFVSFSLASKHTNPIHLGNHLMRHYKVSIASKEGSTYSIVLKRDYLKFPLYRKKFALTIKKYQYKKVDIELNHFYLYKKSNAPHTQTKILSIQ